MTENYHDYVLPDHSDVKIQDLLILGYTSSIDVDVIELQDF